MTVPTFTCHVFITGGGDDVIETTITSGDELLRVLAALANPHRLRIIAALVGRRVHVSQLARELGMSRPLLYLHLQRLEAAGLITGSLELSEDGKAMKYYEVVPFAIALTPERIAAAVATLTIDRVQEGEA